jgi:hypothetical protein
MPRVEEFRLGAPGQATLPFAALAEALVGVQLRDVLVAGPHAMEITPQLASLLPDARWSASPDGSVPRAGPGPDGIVCIAPADHPGDPLALLRRLHAVSAPGARLFLFFGNALHRDRLFDLLRGEPVPALAQDMATLGGCFKLALDAGWLPNLRPCAAGADWPPSLLAAAAECGVPGHPAQTTLGAPAHLVECVKAPPPGHGGLAPAPFTVVVATNHDAQFARDLARSPGLLEGDIEVLSVRGASSAALALEAGRARARHPWIVFAHQDVYFPAGSGEAIGRALARVPQVGAPRAVLGFAGIGAGPGGTLRRAGLVIDRRTCLDLGPALEGAVSLDEFAVIIHRDGPYRLDPALGWHLWATDLCLQALRSGDLPVPAILRIALLHNSLTGYSLPAAFHESARHLRAKNPDLRVIPTLCGNLGAT